MEVQSALYVANTNTNIFINRQGAQFSDVNIYEQINWFSQETRKEVYFHLSLCLRTLHLVMSKWSVNIGGIQIN